MFLHRDVPLRLTSIQAKRFDVCLLQVEQKNQHATIPETEQSMLESQLQTEREALERKEKEVGSGSTQVCVPNFNETDRHTFEMTQIP